MGSEAHIAPVVRCEKWTAAQAEGKLSATIMLDLSAAFDVVDSSILLDKMKPYGFKEPAVK